MAMYTNSNSDIMNIDSFEPLPLGSNGISDTNNSSYSSVEVFASTDVNIGDGDGLRVGFGGGGNNDPSIDPYRVDTPEPLDGSSAGGGGGGGCFSYLFGRNFCDPLMNVNGGKLDNNNQGNNVVLGRDLFARHYQQPLPRRARPAVKKNGWDGLFSSKSSSSISNDKDDSNIDTIIHGTNNKDDVFDDVISSLGKEMGQLSMKERTQIAEEMHGVYNSDDKSSSNTTLKTAGESTSSSIAMERDVGDASGANEFDYDEGSDTNEDNEAFIEDCLEQLQKRLATYHGKMKEPYRNACLLAPNKYGLKQNKQFNIRFIQSAEYDQKVAAEKLIQNFYFKEMLFGKEKLTNDITLDDLDEDDMIALRTGHSMFLPGRDMAGRYVVVNHTRFIDHSKWINHMRANYYLSMKIIQFGEASWKRGVVYVCDELDAPPFSADHARRVAKWAPMFFSFPGKLACCHYCVENTAITGFIHVVLKIIPKEMRLRFRFHFGGLLECQYKLMSYGIPTELMNIDSDGNIKQEYVDIWIQRQREIEKRQQQKQLIENSGTDNRNASVSDAATTNGNSGPTADKVNNDDEIELIATNKDILLGRGVPIQSHPGNVKLAKMIEERWNTYCEATKLDKTAMAWDIVRLIQDSGGRFLERDKSDIGKWKVTPDDTARYKVAYGFRSHMKARRNQMRRELASNNDNNDAPNNKRLKVR